MPKLPTRYKFSGDKKLAAQYVWFGQQLMNKLQAGMRFKKVWPARLQKDSMTNSQGDFIEARAGYVGNTPVVRVHAEQRGAADFLILYLGKLDGNKLIYYGYGPKGSPAKHVAMFTVDLEEITASPGLVTVSALDSPIRDEFYPAHDALGSLIFRNSYAQPWIPPVGGVEFIYRNTLGTPKARLVSGATGTPLNYDGDGEFPFAKLHRGTTRDYMYTTDGIQEIGDDENARIYKREYDDDTRAIVPYLTLPQPIFATAPLGAPPEPIHWPPIGFDVGWPTHLMAVGNGIHIRTVSLAYGDDYIEFYYIPDGGIPTLMLILVPWYKGGSSFCDFNGYVVDFESVVSGFTLSEYDDVAGNTSDLEQVHISDPGIWDGGIAIPHFEFRPSDYLTYTTPRDSNSYGRQTKVWRISEEVYGILLQNNNHEVTPGTNQKPDGLFYWDSGSMNLVYTPVHPPVPDDYAYEPYDAHMRISSLEVDPYRPNLVLCKEVHRWDPTYGIRWFTVDLLTGAVTTVKTTDIFSPVFVR